jgi:hypothetical protein
MQLDFQMRRLSLADDILYGKRHSLVLGIVTIGSGPVGWAIG